MGNTLAYFVKWAISQIGRNIYTDGSKMSNGAAVAAVSENVVKSLRISNKASIFTAELNSLYSLMYSS